MFNEEKLSVIIYFFAVSVPHLIRYHPYLFITKLEILLIDEVLTGRYSSPGGLWEFLPRLENERETRGERWK